MLLVIEEGSQASTFIVLDTEIFGPTHNLHVQRPIDLDFFRHGLSSSPKGSPFVTEAGLGNQSAGVPPEDAPGYCYDSRCRVPFSSSLEMAPNVRSYCSMDFRMVSNSAFA